MFTPGIKASLICGVRVKPLWWNRFSNIHFQCIFSASSEVTGVGHCHPGGTRPGKDKLFGFAHLMNESRLWYTK